MLRWCFMGSMMFVRSFLTSAAMTVMPPAGALACEGLPGADIQVIAKSEPAVLASDLSLSEIDQLARHTGYVGKSPRLGFILGISRTPSQSASNRNLSPIVQDTSWLRSICYWSIGISRSAENSNNSRVSLR